MKEPGVSLEEALEAVKAVHDPDYIAKIKALSERGGGFLDYDTCTYAGRPLPSYPSFQHTDLILFPPKDANYASYECCLLASAAWMDAARHTVLGDSGEPIDTHERPPARRPSFALARPPGHHATRGEAGGFCIFNHCIVAAKYALDHLGCRRVAILDWCVRVRTLCTCMCLCSCLSSEPSSPLIRFPLAHASQGRAPRQWK